MSRAININMSENAVLDRCRIGACHAVIVAIPDALATRQAVAYARSRNPRVEIVARAHSESEEAELRLIGVWALEALPSGGVRLVCMSGDGAATLRRVLKSKLINGDVKRERFRPTRPLW